ncbi:MAG TPA: anthranilate phosphoribosyltransferase [Alphaproteobacteria bacterium]|nr:anthranilate phosphoribosyltransferase [Alphaproteobacteria bacterium]
MSHLLSPSLRVLLENDLSSGQQVVHMRALAIEKLDADILAEAVNLFRTQMIPVDLGGAPAIDMCGTGGDRSGSFNISTTASFVAAAAGVPVAKHGNVSITSKSGGIDLLNALGVKIPDDVAAAQKQFADHGITFLFAQRFHPVFRKFIDARRVLAAEGTRTIFNILGPLLNPAGVQRSIMGVFAPELVKLIAEVKLRTGTRRALIVHGGGMDELTLTGMNIIAEIRNSEIIHSTRAPDEFGFATCDAIDIAGADAEENAKITIGILDGTIQGPRRDIVVLNAAAAIYVHDDQISFADAIARARAAIDNGSALALLQRLK